MFSYIFQKTDLNLSILQLNDWHIYEKILHLLHQLDYVKWKYFASMKHSFVIILLLAQQPQKVLVWQM